MVFELMPFVDTLMKDLGLSPARKGGWRELLEWYGVEDYKGVVKEWMEKEREKHWLNEGILGVFTERQVSYVFEDPWGQFLLLFPSDVGLMRVLGGLHYIYNLTWFLCISSCTL